MPQFHRASCRVGPDLHDIISGGDVGISHFSEKRGSGTPHVPSLGGVNRLDWHEDAVVCASSPASRLDFDDAEDSCVVAADDVQFSQPSWCAPISAEDVVSGILEEIRGGRFSGVSDPPCESP